MRLIFTILLFLIINNQILSQDSYEIRLFKKNFNIYEDNKKDKAVGLLCSSIIPGGGLSYAESYLGGILFFVNESLLLAYTRNYIKANPHDYAGKYSLIILNFAVKLLEYILVFYAVDSYNNDLRQQLNLTFGINDNTKQIRFSLNF